MRRLKTVRRPPIYPKTPGHLPCSSLTHPLPLPSRRPSVSFGGFGLRSEDVAPTVVDTDSIGYTGSTGGSRVAYDTGLAAIATAEEVKRQMVARAATVWEVQPEDVDFRDGVFICTETEDRLTFKELAAQLNRTGGPITCSESVNSPGSGSTFGGNIVDVEVDPETGKVDIMRYTAFIDAGTSVHPSYVECQVQGATVQGIGWALNEEYFYTEDGTMANSSFLDYRMPTSLDVPMIDTVLIEVPNPRHPFGLRGVGEVPIIPPLAALSNAIYSALGASACTICPCPLAPYWNPLRRRRREGRRFRMVPR